MKEMRILLAALDGSNLAMSVSGAGGYRSTSQHRQYNDLLVIKDRLGVYHHR
jgi:hypothetical protein